MKTNATPKLQDQDTHYIPENCQAVRIDQMSLI